MGGAPLGDVIKRAFLEAGLCSIPMFEVFQPAAPLTIELRNVLIELIKKEPGFKPAQQFVVTAQLDGIFGPAHAKASSPPSKKRAASPTSSSSPPARRLATGSTAPAELSVVTTVINKLIRLRPHINAGHELAPEMLRRVDEVISNRAKSSYITVDAQRKVRFMCPCCKEDGVGATNPSNLYTHLTGAGLVLHDVAASPPPSQEVDLRSLEVWLQTDPVAAPDAAAPAAPENGSGPGKASQ